MKQFRKPQTYSTYEKYKSSEMIWLGRIPYHWIQVRVRNVSKVVNGSTPKSSVKEYWDGDITWITPADLGENTGRIISNSSRKITKLGLQNCGASIVPTESLIISTRAPIGHLALTGKESCTNQGCRTLVLVKKKMIPRYVYYYFLSFTNILNTFGQGTTFVELSSDKLKDFLVLTPPLPEQRIIADFLDHQTAKIDALIEKQERLIALLEEKRSALIARAVTKGLDPDAAMKDSGIEWLGEVPEKWKITNVSKLFRLIGSGTTPNSENNQFYEDGVIPWVVTGDLNDNVIEKTKKKITKTAFREISALKLYPKNTLLIAMYGATIGRVALLNFEGCVNQACCALGDSELLTQEFAFYFFLAIRTHVLSLSYGGGQPNISQETIRSLMMIIPSKEEQERIVNFLDKQTTTIDELIKKTEIIILLLNEYKESIIHSAVTGKIYVRDWQPEAKGPSA